jgi:small conductance mechanosensitive channel
MPKPVPDDRSPVVVLDSLGASSVDLKVRAWVKSEDYWTVYYNINQRIYTELPRPGISFPFPQMDVHITQQ